MSDFMQNGDEKIKVKKITDKEKIRTKYVNPLTDFGFKLLFGIKEAMMNFLNSILDIEGGIIDLTYINVEMIPYSEEERQARYDLHCITGTGERIIIEIQNNSQAYYKDRTVYYAAYAIMAQAPKGKDWNYELSPLYSVNILNFRLPDAEKMKPENQQKTIHLEEAEEEYISFVELRKRTTNKLFYDKLTFVYLELPKFTKKEKELKTDAEKWIFLLKNLPKLTDIPTLLNNTLFQLIFKTAEIAKMSKKDKSAYFNSLKIYRDMNNSLMQRDQKIVELSSMYQQREVGYQQELSGYMQREAKLQQENAAYQQENATYQQEIAELRRQLNMKNA
jgi:predicted transposase/invertase (TIGR01784 family)